MGMLIMLRNVKVVVRKLGLTITNQELVTSLIKHSLIKRHEL